MTLAVNSYKVSFFLDGRRLASVSNNGDLRIWDVQTGEMILGSFQGQGRIRSVAISPDGRKIASGHSDGTIVLRDASDETELRRYVGHRGAVLCTDFSPDGTLLASGSETEIGSSGIWEIDSGEPTLRTLAGTGGCDIIFTQDGKYLVSSCGKEVRIHEVESGNVAFVFGGFRALSCFPCGTRAVVRWGHDAFSVLDLTNGKVVSGPFEGHTDEINSVAVTPDGRHIISGSYDGTIRIWDTAAVNNESETFEGHFIYGFTISDDGSRIASHSYQRNSIVILDAQTGDVIAPDPSTLSPSDAWPSHRITRVSSRVLTKSTMSGVLDKSESGMLRPVSWLSVP